MYNAAENFDILASSLNSIFFILFIKIILRSESN